MKPYYILLDEAVDSSLSVILEKHMKITAQEAENLINIGAVWDHGQGIRLKNHQAKLKNRLIKINRPFRAVKPCEVNQEDILHINQHYCIVYKHPGTPSHPTPYSDVVSLAWGLEHYLEKSVYPVNRLDFITGGLIFFALSKKIGRCLQSDFQERKIKKWYLARAEKALNVKKYTLIDFPVTHKNKSKKARTVVVKLSEDETSQYFLVKPQTGRTHQIRVHLARKYSAVWGDKSYGARYSHGTGLYCVRYVFICPVKKELISICHIPDEIREWLV